MRLFRLMAKLRKQSYGIKTISESKVIQRNPVVTDIQPLDNVVLSDNMFNISVHATDSNGIEKVELFIDNTSIGIVNNPPYNISYLTNSFAVGNHLLKAVAYSKSGQTAVSKEIVIKKATNVNLITPLYRINILTYI